MEATAAPAVTTRSGARPMHEEDGANVRTRTKGRDTDPEDRSEIGCGAGLPTTLVWNREMLRYCVRRWRLLGPRRLVRSEPLAA